MIWRKEPKDTTCYTSYLWQELRGTPTFRLQTDDPIIARRLQKRKEFKEIAQYFNSKNWLFRKTFYSNQKALQTFRRVTRRPVYWDTLNEEYCSISYPIVDSNVEPQKMELPVPEAS